MKKHFSSKGSMWLLSSFESGIFFSIGDCLGKDPNIRSAQKKSGCCYLCKNAESQLNTFFIVGKQRSSDTSCSLSLVSLVSSLWWKNYYLVRIRVSLAKSEGLDDNQDPLLEFNVYINLWRTPLLVPTSGGLTNLFKLVLHSSLIDFMSSWALGSGNADVAFGCFSFHFKVCLPFSFVRHY